MTHLPSELNLGYMGQLGQLAFMPFTKCTISEDPSKLNTISELTVRNINNFGTSDYKYECTNPFVRA